MTTRTSRLFHLVLCTLLLVFVACRHAPAAQVGGKEQASAQAVHPPGLFLYEVQSARGPSYLLGTIHMGFGFDEVLTPAARAGFDRSTRVMTEADVGSADPQQMLQAALLPPETSLRTVLGEQTFQKLLARLDKQVPAALLERLEPWFPTVLLSLEDLGRALAELKPGAETKQMDLELMKEAKERGKPVSHFETVQEQLAVFTSIALPEQARELTRMLEDDSPAQSRELLQSFASGDEAALEQTLFDQAELSRAPVFYDRVLFDRNARWLPVIVREVEQGGVFIGVGAGHLLGERGLVAELKKKGYAVTRVR